MVTKFTNTIFHVNHGSLARCLSFILNFHVANVVTTQTLNSIELVWLLVSVVNFFRFGFNLDGKPFMVYNLGEV